MLRPDKRAILRPFIQVLSLGKVVSHRWFVKNRD